MRPAGVYNVGSVTLYTAASGRKTFTYTVFMSRMLNTYALHHCRARAAAAGPPGSIPTFYKICAT